MTSFVDVGTQMLLHPDSDRHLVKEQKGNETFLTGSGGSHSVNQTPACRQMCNFIFQSI